MAAIINPLAFRPSILNLRCPASSLNPQSLLSIIYHFDSRFGKVAYCNFPKDHHTEWYRGFGFIHFVHASSLIACLEFGSIHEVHVPRLHPSRSKDLNQKHNQLRLSDFLPQNRARRSGEEKVEVIRCLVEQSKPPTQNAIEQRATIDDEHLKAHQSIDFESLRSDLNQFGGFFGGLEPKRSKQKK